MAAAAAPRCRRRRRHYRAAALARRARSNVRALGRRSPPSRSAPWLGVGFPVEARRVSRRGAAHGAPPRRVGQQRGGGGGYGGYVARRCEQTAHAVLHDL
eukprot:scaffold14108_cov30-Phaeocystis_antarctica.AAC.1